MVASSMPLGPEAISQLLTPYVATANAPRQTEIDWPGIYSQLTLYLELILKWNSRINLTAIRKPEEIIQRHFGESLFAGRHLGPCDSLLDLGSGAGFPGIPIHLLQPELSVTLAESRTRKAAFLHEAVRTLGLKTEIWADRAESMPSDRRFHTVALRAVDEMDSALAEAVRRAGHRIMILGSRTATYKTLPADFRPVPPIPLPNSRDRVLIIAERFGR